MSGTPPAGPPPRLIDFITAFSVMAAGVVLVGKTLEAGGEARSYPEPVAIDASVEPIASEADVFEVSATEMGIAPAFHGPRGAHERSLDRYRKLRAYPGAPPRVPHSLTDQEYRHSNCNICHLRGGWVARFGNYAPVTPHPQYSSCLQCHLAKDALAGRALPTVDANICLQCHVDPDAPPEIFVELDWETGTWPETDVRALPESPNRIPHDFQMRSNCLACHAGPGAVTELRTNHPERVNCRQCHVAVSEDVEAFPGPPDGLSQPTGGGA